MVVLHKGKRIDNEIEVQGYLTKMWGQSHITTEEDENTAYPVIEESVEPIINNLFDKDVLMKIAEELAGVNCDICLVAKECDLEDKKDNRLGCYDLWYKWLRNKLEL